MRCLKVYFLCSKIATISLQRQPVSHFQTSSHLLIRRRQRNNFDDVGLKHQKQLYEDEEDLDEVTDEGELDFENLKVMPVDKAYDEHIREKKDERAVLRKMIIKKKFFSPPVSPPMLTYNEMECIRYLHKEDPEQWTAESLSESFPATPYIIKKVLRSRYKPSPEEIKKRDMVVQKNWELLAQDKLDAEPHVLNHFKKFMNRRNVLLQQINEANVFLTDPKEEPIWNGGEMTSVLTSYEKALKELIKQDTESSDSKMITDSSESDNKKSSLDMLHEEIHLEKSTRQLKGKESFILGETIRGFSKQMTFEELEKDILYKAERREDLNLTEKAILESKLGVKRKNHEHDVYTRNLNSEISVVETNSSVQESSEPTKENIRYNKNLLDMENKIMDFEKPKKFNKKKKKYSRDELEGIPMPGETTVLINEETLRDISNLESLSKSIMVKKDSDSVVKKPKPDYLADPVRQERDRIYYDAMENDIRDTAFWNNGKTSKEKSLAEFDKADLCEPKAIDKVTPADVSSNDCYPERIKIPKDKRGSGLIFKVNDCYYDDDGEFLYRVPGMK